MGHAAIIVFFLLAFLCLVAFLFLLKPGELPDGRNAEAEAVAIAGLCAVRKDNFDLFFRSDDYRKLKARTELKDVRKRLRRDRRRIILMWFSDLRADIRLLWAFRRFSVRNGLHVTARDELNVALAGALALLYLECMRLVVFIAGPFVLPRMLRAANLPVEWLHAWTSRLLACAPGHVRVQIERKWADQLSR